MDHVDRVSTPTQDQTEPHIQKSHNTLISSLLKIAFLRLRRQSLHLPHHARVS